MLPYVLTSVISAAVAAVLFFIIGYAVRKNSAEKAIGKNGVSADLRFGHDTGLAPLLALLNVNGFGETAGSDDKIYETWADFIVTPMGSNIQFIFYRHAKTGAIIVKVLHNEKESTLPIKTDIFPYYHWEDVSSYFDSLIK
jgi:hypothetical protein